MSPGMMAISPNKKSQTEESSFLLQGGPFNQL